MTTDLRRPHWDEIADTLTGKRAIVHAGMSKHGPCTATELASALHWDKCSVRPRLTELWHAGLIEPMAERRNSEHVFAFVSLAEAVRRSRIEDQCEQGVFQLT